MDFGGDVNVASHVTTQTGSVPIAPDGKVTMYSQSGTHLIADIADVFITG